MSQLYDEIGKSYTLTRATDPRIAKMIWRELGNATTVLNVGAGTGSYEPHDRKVLAVEPSEAMRAQRRLDAAKCVAGVAESLPFHDGSFDVVMSIASHWHWRDQARGFAEMRRVAQNRVVVLTIDRTKADEFWLTDKYLPNAHALWRPAEETAELLGPCDVTVVPIPADCVDGFYHAYWRRPHVYLDEAVRNTMAVFACLDPAEKDEGLRRLRSDLEAGSWHQRYSHLLECNELDLGLRLLVHDL